MALKKYDVTLEIETNWEHAEQLETNLKMVLRDQFSGPATIKSVEKHKPVYKEGAVLLLNQGQYEDQVVAEVGYGGKSYFTPGDEHMHNISELDNYENVTVLFEGYDD